MKQKMVGLKLSLPSITRALVFGIVLAIMLTNCSSLLRGSDALAEDGLPSAFTNFINDSRWSAGTTWTYSQTPKLSSFQGWGCCAYCADFTMYCFGNYNPRGGSAFYDTGEIRAGDVLTVGNQSDGTGHWFVCLKRSGNSLYVAEGNYANKVRIGWNYSIASSNRFSEDSRTFTAGYHFMDPIPVTGTLDVNGFVNGNEVGNIANVGTFNITAGGSTLTGQTDYCRSDLANGSSYSISNVTPAAGYIYTGLRSGSEALSGTIAAGTQKTVWLCFESKTYTVSYNNNTSDTVSNMPSNQTKTHGTALTLASNVPTRQNYDFLGWSTSSTGSTANYQPGGQYTTNANITLYAVWKLKTYTITFNPNGGTVSPSTKEVSYGSAYGSLPTPTRPGYTFDGWFTTAEGGTKVTASTVLTESSDKTVYAHWSQMGELTLPSGIQTIDEESFMGNSHISHVVIPANCATIESKAFANCENLISVRILGRSTTFESDTFANSPNVVIYCYSNSRAQRLANADGLEYHLIGVASDWALVDNVPLGAEIVDRKWTYTLREYTESPSASYTGWTQYDSKRTSWTAWSGWQNNEIVGSSNREVRTQSVITGYNMISYCVSAPQGRSYQPSPTYTVRLQHGPYWWSKAEFDSARVFPSGSYFDFASNVAGYVLDGTGYCKWDGSETGGYVPMFIQSTTYGTQWSYRDAIYTYYYYRDTDKESIVDPSGQESVSNVQEWVKYIF